MRQRPLVSPALLVNGHPGAAKRRACGGAHPRQHAAANRGGVRVDTAVGLSCLLPCPRTPRMYVAVVQLDAVHAVGVDVNDDLVAVLDQRDRAAEECLGRDVTDDETNGSAREASVGHQCDRDVALAGTAR